MLWVPSPAWAPADPALAKSLMFSFPAHADGALMYDSSRVPPGEISASVYTKTDSAPALLENCVEVRHTPDERGRGAYAARHIPAGAFALYDGLLVSTSDEVVNDHPYALDQLPPGSVPPQSAFYAPLVVGCPFSWTSYVNHSKEGASLRLVHGTRGPGTPWPFLQTFRDVAPGEELTLDYDGAAGDGQGTAFAAAQEARAARFGALVALARDPRRLSLDAVFDAMHAWEAGRAGDPADSWPQSSPELRRLWQPLLDLARAHVPGP